MSGEMAACSGRNLAAWRGARAEVGESAARPVEVPSEAEGGSAGSLSVLVAGEGGAAVVGMVAAADPRTIRDELISAAAALIEQAIELDRGLEADAEAAVAEGTDASLGGLVADYERRLIEAALDRTGGNRAQAARLLRTTERILGYRVQRYGIDCEAFRG